jgi:hypothetical protein
MSIFLTSRHSLPFPRRMAQAGVVASSSFPGFETMAFASRRCST